MRSFGVSIAVGILSLTLLATAPSAANAQRVRNMPLMVRPIMVTPMMNAGATSSFMPQLGVQPSRTVVSASFNRFNPATGTFSAVPLSAPFTVPTNGSSMPHFGAASNAFQANARLVSSFGTNPYMMSNGYGSPSMMSSYGGGGSYGGGSYGGGSSGGYGGSSGYGSSYMSASNTNPYLAYSGGGSQPYTPVSSPTPGPSEYNIVEVGLYDNRFEAISVTISVGTKVRWTNYSNEKHSVTSDSGLWDSLGLNLGAMTSYTFTEAGKYTYHSSLNKDIRGTVIVK